VFGSIPTEGAPFYNAWLWRSDCIPEDLTAALEGASLVDARVAVSTLRGKVLETMLRLMTLSARNRLEGKITELQLGGVMAHVVVRVGDNLLESVITRRSAEEMSLKVGDTVSAIIKSTEVMLEKK
jgi:molybdopterin-binding protein